jgi:hypothetical protein
MCIDLLAVCKVCAVVLWVQHHKDFTDAKSNLADECCRLFPCTPIMHPLILNTVKPRPYVDNLQLSDQQAYDCKASRAQSV